MVDSSVSKKILSIISFYKEASPSYISFSLKENHNVSVSEDEVRQFLSSYLSEDLGEEKAPPESDETSEDSYKQFISNKRTFYDPDSDVYTTWIQGLPHAIELPGSVHRDMVRAYSNHDNNPSTVNEIAMTFGLPRSWVTKYLRAHEITHDREPFTPEEIMSRSEDDLAQEALQIRRAAIFRRIENDKWNQTRIDAKKWQEFDDLLYREFLGLLGSRVLPRPEMLDLKKPLDPFCCVMGLSDFHWGKYSDAGENGEGFNRSIAKERLFSCTSQIASRLSDLGRPEKIYVPVGSDFFQIDGDGSTTSRGTPQDVDCTSAEMLVSGCELFTLWIDSMRSIAPVELVLMSGNHDRSFGLALLLYLSAFYKDCDDVFVHKSREARSYVSYGKNLIGFVHGDGVRKVKDLAGHMAREASEQWSECPYRTVYTGHLHYELTEVDVAFGVTKRQLASLSGPDRWHSRSGYVGAPKLLPAYLHSKSRGIIATIYGPAEV
jgi:hypothetical protein